jgi:uncharacterized protein
MRLKLSQFTIPIHNYPSEGKHILYNTLTRAASSINDDGWKVLRNLPEVPANPAVRQWLEALGKHGFVAPEALNEGELYVQRQEQAKANTDYLDVTLSLIQKCNFGCTYCYQGGAESTHDGSKITKTGANGGVDAEEIVSFLKSQCETRNVKRLHFTAYGGEPLLNKSALLEIVSAMHDYCQARDVRWYFDMISNGSLLTRRTVLELKQYGFVGVQITIDGNRETHNTTRPFRNGRGKQIGAYDIIMKNLEAWAGLIYTDVLCVVSQSNIDAAHELIDTLADKGLAEKRVRIKFSPVSPTYDNDTVEKTALSFAENPQLLNAELEVVDAIAKLEIHAARRGLIEDLRPRGTWCAVMRANGQTITITPDGKIYSCTLFIGRDEKYETGHIRKPECGGLDTLMKSFSYPEGCKKCAYLPICSNCRADALARTGDILGDHSHKAQYDLILPQLIRAHYDLRHRAIQR